ncbi:MAG: hypothetical protein EOM44_00605 [Bacteroidia bacterium]|nr:hypothetical protein [Bacteroidia bacterium]
MKKILFLFVISALLISCKSKQSVVEVPVKTVEKVTERLVEIQLPADSAWLTVYLECDSTNQVILRGLSERKSEGVLSDLKFTNGVLDYRAKTNAAPHKATVRDSIVYKEIPVTVEVPTVEYRQTRWQAFTSKIGNISLLLLLLFGAWKLIKIKF